MTKLMLGLKGIQNEVLVAGFGAQRMLWSDTRNNRLADNPSHG